MWREDCLLRRIEHLRGLGMQNVCFKMAGYDPVDIEHLLRLACACGVDLVTLTERAAARATAPAR